MVLKVSDISDKVNTFVAEEQKIKAAMTLIASLPPYYFQTLSDYSSIAACAAATRAMGTRKGEQLT